MNSQSRRPEETAGTPIAAEPAGALRRQIEFEKLIAAIAADFISAASGSEDAHITAALEKIANHAGVQGGAVLLVPEAGEQLVVSHHWRCGGSVLPLGIRSHLTPADLPWLWDHLTAGRICHIADTADLPAAAGREQALLAAARLNSLVSIPLIAEGRLLGALNFVGRQVKLWPAEHLSLLRIVGEIFVSLLRRQRTEAALRKSEAKNKALLDSVPDIMYQVNGDGIIFDIKPSRQHPELSSPELIGRSFVDLLPAHLAKPARDAIAYTLASGQGQLLEYYRQIGDVAYFEARLAKVGDQEVLIIVRDITERRRSEACDLLLLDIAVKVLEEKPLADILLLACQQIKAIFGLPLVWVGRKETGGHVRLFPGGDDEASELICGTEIRWDGGPLSQGPTGKAIRTGCLQKARLSDEAIQPWQDRLGRYGAASGFAFPIRVGGEIFGALTAFACDDWIWSKRTIVHLTGFAEQLALAINNTTSRQRLRLLTTGLAATANAVVIIDRAGSIQWVNPAFLKLTGFAIDEVLRQNVHILAGDRLRRLFYKMNLWQTLRAGLTWQGELENYRRDGSLYNAEMTVTPFRDERGKIVNYIAIIQDVTSRRRAERQMLEARETLTRAERINSLGIMAAGIAHEVNQPLNSLKVTADSMLFWHQQGKTPTLAKIMENIEKISRQADRIDNIIKHMRAFVHSNQYAPPEPCNINAAVREAFSLLGAQLATHGITLETSLAADLPPVLANSIQLEEIIINLLVNAMQSLDAGKTGDKRIAITTARRADAITIQIADNGPGISKKIKNKIFDPFFTTKAANEGMGLGLSIVHSIVTAYGGQINLQPGQRGEGATFRIELPAFTGQERGEHRP